MAEPKPITSATAVSISLVVTLLGGAFNYGLVYSDVRSTREQVTKLEARVESASAQQHAQALELTSLKSDLRFIRESTARIERAVEALTASRQPRRAERAE